MSYAEFTSDAIRSAKFRETQKGYHPDDVDVLLEQAADAVDQLRAELASARSADTTPDGVHTTLVIAQRTAEITLREANETAAGLREEAHAEATAILEAAERRAAAVVDKADRAKAAAFEHATATVDEADAAAQTILRDAEERAHREVEARRAETTTEIERRFADAEKHLHESTAALRAQHDQLWADVANLAEYLASERARVVSVLASAVDQFGATLAPAPIPTVAPPASSWAPPAPEIASEPVPVSTGTPPPLETGSIDAAEPPADVERSSTFDKPTSLVESTSLVEDDEVEPPESPEQTDTDAPAALVDAPAALVDAPAALVDAPAALVDAPAALVDAPAGPADELAVGWTPWAGPAGFVSDIVSDIASDKTPYVGQILGRGAGAPLAWSRSGPVQERDTLASLILDPGGRPVDDPPERLLFILEDASRIDTDRNDTDTEPRPCKPLLGRRRA